MVSHAILIYLLIFLQNNEEKKLYPKLYFPYFLISVDVN